jgi:NADH-quinone oxidoreductase subunit N
VCCLFVIIYSIDILKIEKMKWIFPYGLFEVFPLILFNLLGIFCFLSSDSLLSAYVTLELQSLTLAVLFAIKYFSKYSSEAALKYFIVSSFSTSLLLLAFGFLYGIFGVIHFESFLFLLVFDESNLINFDFYLTNLISFVLLLVFLTFSIKLGVAPFHLWTIDVYEGTSMFITLYALTLPKITYVGFLIKFILYFQNYLYIFNILFFFSGFFSIIVGTLGAILQTKVKRLFAYSAISNFGYVMFSLSIGTLDGLISGMMFLIVYTLVTLGIFFNFFCLIQLKTNLKIKSIFQLQSIFLSGRHLNAYSLAFFLFTIASIPPFNIFIAKYYLLYALIEKFNAISIFSVVFIILMSVISCFYYIRLIRLLFFRNNKIPYNFILYKRVSFNLSILISLVSFFNIFLFFYPEFLFNLLEYIFLN